MLLNLKDISVGITDKIEFSYQLDLKDEVIFNENPLKKPVEISGAVKNMAGVLWLNATINYKLETSCARCLSEITIDKQINYQAMLSGEPGDNEETLYYQNNSLDLNEVLVPTLILDIDFKYLCDDNCKGLCPACGVNLNNEPCSCNKKTNDNRFEILKNLLKDN